MLERFCQNVEVVSSCLCFTLLSKNDLPIFKHKRHIMETCFFIGNLVLLIYFPVIYGQRIRQFISVALTCWTANNTMFLTFKVFVGQWLTQFIFYSVLDSEYCIVSFKSWIFQLNICFLSCDGMYMTPPKRALRDITTEERYYVPESFCHNVKVISWYFILHYLQNTTY